MSFKKKKKKIGHLQDALIRGKIFSENKYYCNLYLRHTDIYIYEFISLQNP